MKKLTLFMLPAFLLFSCTSTVPVETKLNNPTYTSEVENRIEKVLNSLEVSSGVPGKTVAKTLADRMAFYHTPAVSIAVVNNGEIEWARGFGTADIESNTAADTETMFQAASVSKPIFSLAVMKLKEKGVVDLDKDVNEYLTSWKTPKNGDWQPRITLRQLLSHTAGLTVHGFMGYTKSEALPTVVQILNGEEPANSPKVMANLLPGTRFRYSGGGTIVAQLAVTDRLKKDFPEFMEETVFKPLKLQQSTYSQPLPIDFKYKTATAYPYKNQPITQKNHIYPEMAPAGLWTTPTELATVMIEIQKAVQGKSDFIKKETIEEMLTPQEVANWIGIGFMVEGQDEAARFNHGGWNEGFLTEFIGYKNSGKGVVVMINSNEGEGLLEEIIHAVAKEYEWPDYLPKDTKFDVVDESIVRNTGTYGDYKLDYANGKLFLVYKNQDPIEVKKTPEGSYKNEYMSFEIKMKEKEMEFTQAGQTITLDKED